MLHLGTKHVERGRQLRVSDLVFGAGSIGQTINLNARGASN